MFSVQTVQALFIICNTSNISLWFIFWMMRVAQFLGNPCYQVHQLVVILSLIQLIRHVSADCFFQTGIGMNFASLRRLPTLDSIFVFYACRPHCRHSRRMRQAGSKKSRTGGRAGVKVLRSNVCWITTSLVVNVTARPILVRVPTHKGQQDHHDCHQCPDKRHDEFGALCS